MQKHTRRVSFDYFNVSCLKVELKRLLNRTAFSLINNYFSKKAIK